MQVQWSWIINQFIIMFRQQISGTQKQIQEGEIDVFQEFKQQYTTYIRKQQSSPSHTQQLNDIVRHSKQLNQEKTKLKMIQPIKSKELQQNCWVHYQKGYTKNNSSNWKCINIDGIIFRSNFQSGNISSVQKNGPSTFEIYLNSETNSDRLSAWFYFVCEGIKGQAKFIIKGFRKSTSLYNQGMKICCKEGENSQWRRGGTKISYSESYSENQDARKTYQLKFTYFFKNSFPNSTEFAYCFPYTYTNLINFLTQSKQSLTFKSLGKSYMNRDIPLVTIGNQSSDRVVVISARAHPGQTVGSWMMQGFIKELIADNESSQNLRETLLFKIIPMINVDGVVQGNYRFSGSGYDLNRKWKSCKEKYHPEVYLIKNYIKSLSSEKQIIMFIDLHGHSRQKNVFFYGCCPKGAVDAQGRPNLKPKQFPFLMSKIHSPFRYQYCSYAVQKEKQGTARIALWKQLKIDTVYTLEASFCGSEGGQNYQTSDYQKIGAKLCYGISIYFSQLIESTVGQFKIKKSGDSSSSKLAQQYKKNIQQFYSNPSLGFVQFQGNSSDSEPEAGQIPEQQRDKLQSIDKNERRYRTSKAFKIGEKSSPVKIQKSKTKDLVSNSELERINQKSNSLGASKVQSFQLGSKPYSTQLKNRKTVKTSYGRNVFKNNSMITDKLQKTVHEKLHELSKVKNITQQNSIIQISAENTEENYQSEQLFPSERSSLVTAKRKAFCFQGAQYRRVRKLAQEHNRRLFSVQQMNQTQQHENSILDFQNILQIDQIKPKHRTPSFFPNTLSKNKPKSIQMNFKKQIKDKNSNAKRFQFQINGINHEVRNVNKKY